MYIYLNIDGKDYNETTPINGRNGMFDKKSHCLNLDYWEKKII